MHERGVDPFRYVCFQKDDRYRRAARAILLAATAGAISPGLTSAHVYGRRTETGMGEGQNGERFTVGFLPAY